MVQKLRIFTAPTGLVTPSLKGFNNIGSGSEFKDDGGDLDITASRLTKVDNKSDVNNNSNEKYAKQLSKLNKKFKGNYSKYVEINRYGLFLNRYLK